MNKLHLLPLLPALLLAGCLSRGDDSSIEDLTIDEDLPAERDPANELRADFHEPFRAAIDARLGRTSADVARAANAAKVKLAVECLHMAGHSPSISNIEALIVTDPFATTTGLDVAIETVTTGQTDVERLGIPETHLRACIDDAERRINPELALSQWLDAATREISERLAADPVMQAALDEQIACIAATGLHGDDLEEFSEEEWMASEITFDFLTGDIRQADALDELEALAAQRAAREELTHAVERCVGQRLSVERMLVAEQQRTYLEAHPGWADEVAASYRGVIDTRPE